jgi:hypothetical protein
MTERDPETRYPIGDILPLEVHPLPEGWQAIEAFVLVKCEDDEGETSWVYRTSRAPNREELLGALTIQVELLRRELVADWVDDE